MHPSGYYAWHEQPVSVRARDHSVVVPNVLAQQFQTDAPHQIWVTDITYIRTHEG